MGKVRRSFLGSFNNERHIQIAGRRVRISGLNLSHHVARHLGYVPHFVRRGCDKTSNIWVSARLLFPPSPDTCPNTVFPPSGNDSSYGDQEFLSVCTEENRKLELVPFSVFPKGSAPLRPVPNILNFNLEERNFF